MSKVVVALDANYNGVIWAYSSTEEAEADILHKCRELSNEDKLEARACLQFIELEVTP